jgi:hypothetical protein
MTTKIMPKATTKKTSSLTDKHTNGTKPQNDTNNSDGIKGSFYEKNKHLAGCLNSGLGDLSSNKEYLKGFGRSRNADSH